jgi:hypothetical protein
MAPRYELFVDDTVEAPPPARAPKREAAGRRVPAQRCKGKNKDGKRCRRYAMRGGTRCRNHSRGAEIAKARKVADSMTTAQLMATQMQRGLDAAALDLAEAAPEAVKCLREIIENPDSPAHAKSRAAEVLLRMAGLGGKQSVDVNVRGRIEHEHSVADAAAIVQARLDALAAAPPIVEGTVIEQEKEAS